MRAFVRPHIATLRAAFIALVAATVALSVASGQPVFFSLVGAPVLAGQFFLVLALVVVGYEYAISRRQQP